MHGDFDPRVGLGHEFAALALLRAKSADRLAVHFLHVQRSAEQAENLPPQQFPLRLPRLSRLGGGASRSMSRRSSR